ncbi:hypothetical protein IWX64_003350 [Arthrobacter sp. CAN_A212]|uniref:hypothetical protein n=1 Tax=Arthrobacter sp. CAN_A212 TaxID=2787719 RepID=UPI0018CB7B64
MGEVSLSEGLKSRRRSAFRGVTVTAAVLGLLASGVVPASAVQNPDEQVVSLIERVAPNQGDVVGGTMAQGSVLVTSGASTVSIPEDPGAPISIEAPNGTAMDVSLPVGLALEDGQIASDGTVVYQSADDSVDSAVQTLNDGSVRVQTIIRNQDAAHEFSYGLGSGFEPVEAFDGSISAVKITEDGFEAFNVSEPWARDATGKDIPTHYQIRGNDLVQVVMPAADTVYPVVADPQWTWFAGGYGAKFNKRETRNFASYGSAVAFCGVVPGTLKIACAIAGGSWFIQARTASNSNQCIFLAAIPAPIAIRYTGSGCY